MLGPLLASPFHHDSFSPEALGLGADLNWFIWPVCPEAVVLAATWLTGASAVTYRARAWRALRTRARASPSLTGQLWRPILLVSLPASAAFHAASPTEISLAEYGRFAKPLNGLVGAGKGGTKAPARVCPLAVVPSLSPVRSRCAGVLEQKPTRKISGLRAPAARELSKA